MHVKRNMALVFSITGFVLAMTPCAKATPGADAVVGAEAPISRSVIQHVDWASEHRAIHHYHVWEHQRHVTAVRRYHHWHQWEHQRAWTAKHRWNYYHNH